MFKSANSMTHMDALNPFISKLMLLTLRGGLWTFLGEFSTLCGWPKVVMENHTRTPAVHGKSHAWNSKSDWTPRKLTLEFGLTLGWGVGGGSIIFQKAGGLAITTILANIAGTNRSFQILTGSFNVYFLFWQIKSYSKKQLGIAKKNLVKGSIHIWRQMIWGYFWPTYLP